MIWNIIINAMKIKKAQLRLSGSDWPNLKNPSTPSTEIMDTGRAYVIAFARPLHTKSIAIVVRNELTLSLTTIKPLIVDIKVPRRMLNIMAIPSGNPQLARATVKNTFIKATIWPTDTSKLPVIIIRDSPMAMKPHCDILLPIVARFSGFKKFGLKAIAVTTRTIIGSKIMTSWVLNIFLIKAKKEFPVFFA
jgi:hypothetical protein